MAKNIQRDITVTSKGQLTLPIAVRKAMKLGAKRKIRLSMTGEGLVTLKPLPDVMSYFGVLKNGIPHDPREKQKARQAMGRRTSRSD